MDSIEYVGELLWPRNVGYFLVLLALFSAILGSYSYFQSNSKKSLSWKQIGDFSFLAHSISIIGIVSLLFFLMIEKRFEYSYVQAHVSDDLPFQYLFSAFWEGQEGSFLLWMFWHSILGFIILLMNNKWTAPVLGFLLLIEVFLVSMILGIHVEIGSFIYKFGSNPFTLLRDTMNIPLFANAEYVSLLQGTGLNPLLQNYWMTIHPPTLFLGFASVSIPFCYAASALLNKDHTDWLRAVMPWAFFSGSILGIGILMGAAWAYEALSFGGYWAWDPVENSSLVPWIVMVAGIHANIVAVNTKHSIKTAYWMYMLSFILIIYSTVLTRSGVLGETSVHAFTEMGLEAQLFIFNIFFLLLCVILYSIRQKNIPTIEKEESIISKEFWMFIGTLVLLFSSIMITFSTSLPLFNKLIQVFNPDFTSMVINEPIPHYNKYQIWIAIFIGLLSGFAQFLRFNEHSAKYFKNKATKRIALFLILTSILTYVINQWMGFPGIGYGLLMFASLFTIICNLDLLIFGKLFRLNVFTGVVSHIGFGLMIIGIMASGINQETISVNRFMFSGLMGDEMVERNIQLIKGKPMFMSNYWVTYESDSLIDKNRYFNINFKRIDETEEVVEEFNLSPHALYTNDFSKIATFNPDTKHYWNKDIFTRIAGLPAAQMDRQFAQEMEDTLVYDLHKLTMNEWTDVNHYQVKVDSFSQEITHPEYESEPGDITIQLNVSVRDTFGKEHHITPAMALRSSIVYKYYEQVNDVKSRFRVNEASFENLVKSDNELDYTPFELKVDDHLTYKDYELKFNSIIPMEEADIPNYQNGDLGVSALIEVTAVDGRTKLLSPQFIIRNKNILPVRVSWIEEDLYLRFTNINPETAAGSFIVAKGKNRSDLVTLEVAKSVPRNDIIVLEAIVFPGINLFWLGSVAMMLGLFLSIFVKRKKKA